MIPRAALYASLAALLVASGILALALGEEAISLSRILSALFAPSSGASVATETDAVILREIRAPRILLAMTIGASLALSGAVLQGLFRNPLAEPSILGISSGAALGAVIALYSGMAAVAPSLLPLCAITGALLAAGILLAIPYTQAHVFTLILAGAGVNALCVPLIALAMSLSPNPWAVSEIAFWLLGSLKGRSMDDVRLALPFMGAGWALMLFAGRSLDALTLGEDTAHSLGVRLHLLRLQVVLGSALACGAGIAMAGAVGFIGLIAPHLLRPMTGAMPGRLLLPAALAGALLLTCADLAVRLIPLGPEIHLGVFTALFGAPFFFFLLLKAGRRAL